MDRIRDRNVLPVKLKIPAKFFPEPVDPAPGRTVHRCPDCAYTTNKKSNLGAHKIRKHTSNPAEFPFVCQVCDARFKAKQDEQRHSARHHSGLVSLHFHVIFLMYEKNEMNTNEQ